MISLQENGCYCLTLEAIDAVDIFIKPVYKQIIVHSLNHFIDSKGLNVYGWCLVSNRLYIVCQTQHHISLTDIRDRFKKFTTEKIIAAINNEPDERKSWLLEHFEKPASIFTNRVVTKGWKTIRHSLLIDMDKPENMAEHLEMIHSIPVKERIVQYASDYLYSSARDYEGLPGLVKITKLSDVEQELRAIENRKSNFKANYFYRK